MADGSEAKQSTGLQLQQDKKKYPINLKLIEQRLKLGRENPERVYFVDIAVAYAEDNAILARKYEELRDKLREQLNQYSK